MRAKRKRRHGTSLVLVLCGVVLVVSITVGERLGDRVLRQSTERRAPIVAAPPTVPPIESSQARRWKRSQVISVATDPAFPDPRVTPTPEPSRPPQRLTPFLPVPRPAPSVKRTATPTAAPRGDYTSPPLPIPLVTPSNGGAQASSSPTDAPTPP